MKIRNLLIAVAMLSVLLCGAVGTAFAVLGVADDVPGQDLVIPFLCGREDLDNTNTLNTLYTIAEVKGTGAQGVNWVTTDRVIYNRESQTILDFPTIFTSRDLLSFDCKTDFTGQSLATKDFYTVTIPAEGGKKYLAGYVILQQIAAVDGICAGPGAPIDPFACTSTLDCLQFGIDTVCDRTLINRFVGWEYLVDLQKGFASGFNAFSMENGAGQALEEDGGNIAVTAESFYPRIYVHNALAQTWNWWIILAGRNQLDCGAVTPFPGRRLSGFVCSPEEVCTSFTAPIPFELNVIDMLTELPQVASIPGFPKSAFAIGTVVETFSFNGAAITLNGSVNLPGLCGLVTPAYSIYGLSYQRAQSDNPIGGFNGSWDVIHPMHRDYCSGAAIGLEYIDGPVCGGDI